MAEGEDTLIMLSRDSSQNQFNLMSNALYSDLILLTTDGRIPCHVSVLAPLSPLLQSILLSYSSYPGLEHTVVTPFNLNTAKHILDLIYHGQVSVKAHEKDLVIVGLEELGISLPGLQSLEAAEKTHTTQEQECNLSQKDLVFFIGEHKFVSRSSRMCSWGHSSKLERCMYSHKVGVSRMCPKLGCKFASKIDLNEDEAKHSLEEHLKTTHKVGYQVVKGGNNSKLRRKSTKEESTCQICYKLFDNKFNAKRHLKQAHDQTTRFQCDDCEKSYAAETSLQYHILRQHTRKHEEIKCDKCDQNFHSFEDYAQHKQEHRPRSFQVEEKCDICGIVIVGKSNLSRHYRNVHKLETRLNMDKVDVDVYPFKCDKCKARFKRSDNLKRHHKTHNLV